VATRAKPVPDIVRYPSGTLKMRGSRLGDEMHGAWKWYRADGTVMRTGRFDRGTQIGVWKTFARSGRLVKETKFARRPRAPRGVPARSPLPSPSGR
jgi:antitoxin component YwqK of YwqJK toxin-antitoxin module